jgi:4-amino-4-deoxy-L-arabinose transferase-like glycosyltransferase
MKAFGLLNKRYLVFLLLIVLLGGILRVWNLSRYPTGFTPDEASFGYDAYSLLKTGKDQWGSSWPISFRSFGDFKLPVYTYLTIPSLALFGFSESAVRLPNAIFGVLAILSTYLMAEIVFKNKRVAIFSALLLAISPWHIALSRGAFESNLTVFFMSMGVWAFYKGVGVKKWMALSAILFGINIFTYHSARFVTPILLLILIWVNGRDLDITRLKDLGKVFLRNIVPVIIFGAFLVLAFYTLSTGSGVRASDITIFSPTDKWMGVFNSRYNAVFDGMSYGVAVFFNNKIFDTFMKFIIAYAVYISPQFLFTQGASEWTYGMVPGQGVMYLFEFLFLSTSAYFIVKQGLCKSKGLCLVVLWIFIGFIPAALTKGPGYAGNRAAVVMPAIQVLSAFGAVYIFDVLGGKINKKIVTALYLAVIAVSFVFFLEAYLYVAPRSGADGMLYGRREAIDYSHDNGGGYKTVVVSRSLSEPQIFIAFYTKFDPVAYQKDSRDWLRYRQMGLPFVDQLGEYRLGKYIFKNINYIDDSKIPEVLIIGKPSEFPGDIVPTRVISYPNQNPALYIVDPQDVSFLRK